MDYKEKKFIFAAGGTGGHIFPAIAVYEYLKKIKPQAKILFIISKRHRDKLILEKYNCRYKILPTQPLPAFFSFGKFWGFAFGFLKSVIKSLKILRDYEPDLVVGFGSYISGPIGLAASFKKKDIILHEQNVLPSKTNLFLKRFAKLVLLNFKETKKFFSKTDTLVIGNPLREDLRILEKKEVFRYPKDTAKNFNILVMGGSQGAQTLNRVVPEAVSLINKDKKDKITILHLAGSKAEDIQEFYRQAQIKAQVKDFLKEVELWQNVSNLAITRAGALTLSELAFFGLPAILVPYVHDKGFQLANARYYAKKGAVFLLEEKDFNPQNLRKLIEELMEKPHLLISMSKKMLEFKKISAARDFSDIILNYKKNESDFK